MGDNERADPPMVMQLREAIQGDGRSLNQLAKAAGLDAGRLSRFMRGERDINFEAACRLCEALGASLVFPKRPKKPADDKPPNGRRKRGRS